MEADNREPGGKGARTRHRLLEAAEQIFAELGYHDASIVKITEAAGVAQGTFYLYFSGKQAIFDVLVEDLNRRVRHAMALASARGRDRLEVERLGFEAFFRFTAEHPALYRIIRQAEFVSPKMLRLHYERLAEGYIEGLRQAGDRSEIAVEDPVVTAWALMAVGEMVGMRWILWGDTKQVPADVFEQTMAFVARALGLPAPGAASGDSAGDDDGDTAGERSGGAGDGDGDGDTAGDGDGDTAGDGDGDTASDGDGDTASERSGGAGDSDGLR